MSEPAIRLERVTKSFGSLTAVSGLSITVPEQSIFGFLGPNGAGKTMTIRLLLGLQTRDSGKIILFGRPFPEERIAVLRRIGSLVDSPSLYSHLTGEENLEVHRQILALPRSHITEVLATVNLSRTGSRLVRHYSQGMRQRLGVALALLGEPDLLILDEPTNGLDPEAMLEMRALIRDLPKRRGVTIFISSHLLAEVEQTATHIGIISYGRCIFEGTRENLVSRRVDLRVEVDQPERARQLLENAGYIVTADHRGLLIQSESEIDPAQINRLLFSANLTASHLAFCHATLEEIFLELVQESVGVRARE